MIIFIGDKHFKKFWEEKQNRKAFVGHHPVEPIIIDATDGESKLLTSMSSVFSLQGFSAGGKLLIGTKKEDKYLSNHISPSEVKKARKKFFKSLDFRKNVLIITKTFIENKGKVNICVVLTQSSYDALSKEYIKQICKLLKLNKKGKDIDDVFDTPPEINDIDDIIDIEKKADVFFTYKDLKKNSGILKRKPSKKELKALEKGYSKALKKIEN